MNQLAKMREVKFGYFTAYFWLMSKQVSFTNNRVLQETGVVRGVVGVVFANGIKIGHRAIGERYAYHVRNRCRTSSSGIVSPRSDCNNPSWTF